MKRRTVIPSLRNELKKLNVRDKITKKKIPSQNERKRKNTVTFVQNNSKVIFKR